MKLVQFMKLAYHEYLQNPSKENVKMLIDVLRFMNDFLKYIQFEGEEEERLKNYQKVLAKNNLVNLLLSMMCNHQQMDYQKNYYAQKILKVIILLMINMLEGGNYYVQNQCYKYFISEQNSENFFSLIHSHINNQILISIIQPEYE